MNHLFTAGAIGQIAMLGNHLPRQCGIATFTTDLSDAIAGEFSMLDCFVVAMNDVGKHYVYPPRVRYEGRAMDEITRLSEHLVDDVKRFALRERAAAFGRSMLWPAVARSYLQSFGRARGRRRSGPRVSRALTPHARMSE